MSEEVGLVHEPTAQKGILCARRNFGGGGQDAHHQLYGTIQPSICIMSQ